MFFRNKARRRPSTTPVAAQALESRALMSATAGVSNNTLTITGTAGNDRVVVDSFGSSTRVQANGSTKYFPSSQISSLVVNLGAGNDSFTLRHGKMQFDRVAINMGTGTDESLEVQANLIKTLIVDARSTTTYATMFRTTVTTLQADFGAGADRFFINSGTVIDRIKLNMGGGDDKLQLLTKSGIRTGQINLGDGNDSVLQALGSRFGSTITPGSGSDTFVGYRVDGGPKVDSFETVSWL